MPITYPLTLPSSPKFRKLTWDLSSAVGEDEDEFSYQQTHYEWSGQLRRVTVELPPMTVADAKTWQAWAMKLNGKVGTFYLKEPTHIATPRGNVADGYASGLVNGADQTGVDLITDGWQASVTDLFKEGDTISIADRMYSVLNDVNSDAGGNATLTLWPRVASPADNAAISVGTSARGKFRLVEWPSFAMDYTRLMVGFSFTAREDL